MPTKATARGSGEPVGALPGRCSRGALDLLASGKYPFADLPRRVVGLDDAAELLETMAGERGVPPVHGVLVP